MVDSNTPWQILSQARPNLPQLMGAVQETRRGRLAEMMLNKQMEREDRQEQTRAKATELYRSGDRKAAREEAIAGGDFDLAGALGKLGEEEAAMVQRRADAIGSIAQWADTPEKWDRGVDMLVAQGYDDLAKFKGGFSEEARMAAISSAGQIKEYFDRTKPVNMAPGGRLVDPTNGRVIAEAPFAPHYGTVSPGQTAFVTQPGSSDAGSIFQRMIGAESNGQQFGSNGQPLTSPAGAIGIAQVMPGTAPEAAKLAGLPFDENRYRTDPQYNAALGQAYFNKQLQDFGDPAKAVAAYNAGPGAVQNAVARYGNDWLSNLPAETQNYVGKVLGPNTTVIAQGGPKPSKQWRTMTPQEVEQRGLPAGVWQEGPDGQIKPVQGATGKNAPQSKEAYSQSAMDAFDRAISSAERLMNHPGFSSSVGMRGVTGGLLGGWVVPGTDAADFRAELEAMKAQVFLPMVQSMKGMGALSNAEGQKLTDAIGALDPNMSETGFKASLNRIIGDLKTYRNRAVGGEKRQSPTKQAARNKPSVSNW